ncbi:MAG: hypothetical protein LBU87_02225 [Lactobacillales bacterium]|jgi:hypothetical protein|nr:hypothetical protein [Lactobacillales bacterium]
MKKSHLAYMLFLPLAVFMAWNIYMFSITKEGATVHLPITGYDPKNLLSGHYIDYRINWTKADCRQFRDNICPKKEFKGTERMYIPEKYAAQLDRMLASNIYTFEILYAYREGRRPIVKDMLINNRPWRELVR